jgi:YHS domain-containing protein
MSAGDALRKVRVGAVLLLLVGASASALAAESKDASAAKKDTPYPLSVCLVSDEKLGEMGEPHAIKYKGREIKFCCESCEKDFRDNADKYVAKLDKAAKSSATKPATQKSDKEDAHKHGHDDKHGHDHKH